MSVVPREAQYYPGLSVMRKWSCLPLLGLRSPQLPLAQSLALELERQRLSSHRFIIAHKAAALIHRGAAPGGRIPGQTDPTHSHIREADGRSFRKAFSTRGKGGGEKMDFESMGAKPSTLEQTAEKQKRKYDI